MPKEKVIIPGYLGMAGSADPRDVKPGLALYAKNLDMVRAYGVFTGLPEDVVSGDTNFTANNGRFIKFENGTGGEGMVWQEVSSTDLRASSSVATLTSSMSDAEVNVGNDAPPVARSVDKNFCGASDGLAVHMGFGSAAADTYKPLWYGYFAHDQLDIDTTAEAEGMWTDQGFGADNAELEQPPLYCYSQDTGENADAVNATFGKKLVGVGADGKSIDNTENNLIVGTGYRYYASAIYDLTQEGPLKWIFQLRLSDIRVQVRTPYKATWYDAATLTGAYWNSGGSVADTDVRTYTSVMWQEITSANKMIQKATGLRALDFKIYLKVGDNAGARSLLNRRITGFNIYRSEIVEGDEGHPYFLKYIDINNDGWTNDAANPTTTGSLGELINETTHLPLGRYYYYSFSDDEFTTPDTYTDLTEVPAKLDNMKLHYGMSVAVDGYHVVGDAWHDDLKDVQAYLFRSKLQRFDTFDWSNDWLVLPTQPTALAAYAGRLYAFAPGRTYVVNVHSFDMEDVWEGIGCRDQRSVVVTDKGMFWCDNNNIYHHDGTHLNVIGEPVLTNLYDVNAGYTDADLAYEPLCVYDPRYDSFMVWYVSATDADLVGLTYHVSSRRWQAATASAANTTYSALVGAYYLLDGTPVLVIATAAGTSPEVLHLNAHATSRKAWTWVGYNMPNAGHTETYYDAHIFCLNNQPTNLFYYENDPSYTSNGGAGQTATVVSADGKETTYRINTEGGASGWTRARSFSIRLEGSASTGAADPNGHEDVHNVALVRRVFTDR